MSNGSASSGNMVENAKSLFSSKTLLYNVLMAVLAMAMRFYDQFQVGDFEGYPTWFLMLFLLGNLVLRFMTGKPIALKFPGRNWLKELLETK